MSTKKRTIYYERAVWPAETGSTLQEALSTSLATRPSVIDTRLPLRDGKAEVRHRMDHSQGLHLHIAAWTDREPMSTVPHPSPAAPSADLAEEQPGSDWDYLDGAGMVLVSGNHCLTMPSGLHKSSIAQFLHSLILHGPHPAGLVPSHAADLRLLAIARPDIARLLDEQGVKRIRLNVGQYAEIGRERDDRRSSTIVQSLRDTVWGTLLDMITNDADRREIEQAENVSAKLVISIDSRRRGLTHEALSPVASRIFEEGAEDIEIETKTGQRIRSGQLVLTKSVPVKASAKTVHHNHAWELMQEFFAELRRAGALEQ